MERDYALMPYWIIFLSLEGRMSGTKPHIGCGPAVTVRSNPYWLQPWSYTKRSHQENLDFTADAVEKVFTILPLVDTTLSMKSCSTSHMFPLHIG
jgi:hypothetical protein